MSYSYRDQLSIIRNIVIRDGDRKTLDCPFCGGQRKFTISKVDGVLLWNCYRSSCTVKGSYTGQRSVAALKRKLEAAPPVVKEAKVTPLPAVTKNIFNEPTALQYVTDNNCLSAYESGYINIRYAPVEKRVLFFNSDSTGAVGRTLINSKYKWWTYGSLRNGIHVGEGDTAVLVEDTPSACAVSRLAGFVGVAMLGTSITEDMAASLTKYHKTFIVLDKDASSKSIALARAVSMDLKVRLTKYDLKQLSVDDIKGVLQM